MTKPPSIDLGPIASRLEVSVDRVRQTLALLDEGNTVAFITRYRKDQTGGLEEEQIRSVQREAAQSRQLAERKASVLKLIDAQEKLTVGLRKRIESAKSAKRLEELYLPFKSNKQSLASLARQRGLAPLADEILTAKGCDLESRAAEFLSPEHELRTTADVLTSVKHLVAESFGERTEVRAKLRQIFARTATLICTKQDSADATQPLAPSRTGETESASAEPIGSDDAIEGVDTLTPKAPAPKVTLPKVSVRQRKRNKLEDSLRDYFDYRESIEKIRPHRILAINRGERAKILRVRLECDLDALSAAAMEMLVDQSHPNGEFLRECVRTSLTRSLVPSLEREVRREMSEAAESHAVSVFAKNLRNLFLQRPVHGRRVLAIDPGFKSGCKLAAVDEFGSVVQHETIYLIGDEARRAAARAKIVEFVTAHDLSVIAIGNGAACRDAEQIAAAVIGDELRERPVEYVIVNEAGASVYSTSAIGREELPDCDATIRSAVSIGRRLLDPLSELVKINPANIGVGMYQHDVKAKHLRESLDAVIESCVNFVGVDLNTASPSLLSYVSGLNQLTARRLYEYRLAHGPYRNREQIREVPGIGETTFVQAAGFLKITGGDNPFDATWIHPESYDIAKQVLERLGSSIEELAGCVVRSTIAPSRDTNVPDEDPSRTTLFAGVPPELHPEELARELGIGELSLRDILDSLAKPGRDPRDDLPAPTFRSGIIKIDDIEPGMELSGTVLNVVDFGAFVDIGISDTSLIHISRLADRYIGDPHEVVGIGDVLRVWVLEVDRERRRVVLTAIPPVKRSSERHAPRKDQAAQPKREPETKEVLSKKSGPRPPKFSQAARRKVAVNRQPAKPITQQMVQGKEPMRTFSDLFQYYEVKQQGDSNETPDE
ncbi:MAG TPA: Tex-like N-terminal domain-containing protein [Pirellulaceae bacterium]|nr:Tex-like N-terminal domain-containing protein [Pirellulaceae bacterium]